MKRTIIIVGLLFSALAVNGQSVDTTDIQKSIADIKMEPAAGIVPPVGMERPAVIQLDRADREIKAQTEPGAGLKILEPLLSKRLIVQLPVLGGPDVPDVAEESPADHLEDREWHG